LNNPGRAAEKEDEHGVEVAVSPEGHIAGSFRPGHISPLGYLIINTTYFRLQLFGEVIEPHDA